MSVVDITVTCSTDVLSDERITIPLKNDNCCNNINNDDDDDDVTIHYTLGDAYSVPPFL